MVLAAEEGRATRVNQPEPPFEMKVFAQAENFHMAHNVLSERSDARLAAMVGYPAMVLSAFASELYLKCLLLLEKRHSPNTHDLKKLFELLSNPAQLRITNLWDEQVRRKKDYWTLLQQHAGPSLALDLPSALAAGAKSFEIMRYIHEGTPQGFSFFLTDLPEVLRQSILEVQPLWMNLQRLPLKLGV
jgi:hypothetical protein